MTWSAPILSGGFFHKGNVAPDGASRHRKSPPRCHGCRGDARSGFAGALPLEPWPFTIVSCSLYLIGVACATSLPVPSWRFASSFSLCREGKSPEPALVSTPPSGRGHVHAYQTMNNVQAISIVVKKTLKRFGGVPPNSDQATDAVLSTPAMMLAQRFALYGNTRDSRTIAIAVSITMAPTNTNPCVI